ncbi:DM13 domain-containing protein [Streptomyces sp. NPDC047706]|uniref:DM13 domain-containing protein n=1 Tax=Streptomyces sp. NPDC047706 TaxID=3365486 RepID=UPI0037213C0A
MISHEHTAAGTARLVLLTDGFHVVRMEDIDTSNGPDVRGWLTDAPVRECRAGWHVFGA